MQYERFTAVLFGVDVHPGRSLPTLGGDSLHPSSGMKNKLMKLVRKQQACTAAILKLSMAEN
jgi:hypothetical protein